MNSCVRWAARRVLKMILWCEDTVTVAVRGLIGYSTGTSASEWVRKYRDLRAEGTTYLANSLTSPQEGVCIWGNLLCNSNVSALTERRLHS